ncbi:unnamed protein product [Microthlaspi erraticum]|uniref:Uncharacterized protein n=1 Tax=Microthlaspi erraticum TaxID=1685480 RepID=A0A6D2IF48_9BRAS|nr:unnamed protein product [Microthlaspi erraticum]
MKETKATLDKEYGLVCKNALEVGTSEWWNLDCGYALPPSFDLMSMELPTQHIADAWFSEAELTESDVRMAYSNAYAAFCIGRRMVGVLSEKRRLADRYHR